MMKTQSVTDCAFSIGSFSVWRIEEWAGQFAPPEHLFAEFEKNAFEHEADSLTPDYLQDGNIFAFLQSWLIDTGDLRIVVDTGAGNHKERPGIPIFGQLETDFLANFRATGFKEDDIDLVICTHLHIDHVGWNTFLDKGTWSPTFPNARYLMPMIERDTWDPKDEGYATLVGAEVNQNVFEDSVQPIIDLGLAEFVSDQYQVCEGIVLRDAPGHTPGHMLVDVENGGDRALFTGDILHHPMQVVRPDWNSVYCEDRERASATRRAVLELAASSGARIVPAHFGGSHTVFVNKVNDDSFDWVDPLRL